MHYCIAHQNRVTVPERTLFTICPDQVFCATFTKKCASNMHEGLNVRVRDARTDLIGTRVHTHLSFFSF